VHIYTKRQSCLVISLALFSLAGVLVWYSAARVYFVMEFHGPGSSAIWHDDEAFIFLDRNVSGTIARRYQVLLQTVIGAFWYRVPPEKLHEDLIVIHVKGENIERYCLKDFGSGGGAFPLEGTLYFSRGGDAKDWPYVWRWSGTNFIRVSRAKAVDILNQFPPDGSLPHSVSEQIQREGWEEEPWLSFYEGKETRYTMDLQSQSLTIVTSRSRQGETVILEGGNGARLAETLSRTSAGGYRQITRGEYQMVQN
jgi:hypothetical protein